MKKLILGTPGSGRAYHTTDLLRDTACPKCKNKSLWVYSADDKDLEGGLYDFIDKSNGIFIACDNKCGFRTEVFIDPESGKDLAAKVKNSYHSC